MTLNLCGSGAI